MVWRPTVGVDVDDVLAGFTADTLRRIFDETRGRHFFTLDDVSTWDPFDSLPETVRDLKELIYGQMKEEGACFNLPVVEGAQEGMKLLREVADVVIVTSPWRGSKTWAHERELWVEHHFNVDHRDVYQCRRKARVHVDFFIDDKPQNVQEWASYHDSTQGILWATPMNRHAPAHLSRIGDWKEVVRYINAVRHLREAR